MIYNKYFKIFNKKSNPKLRLFCFPYAGGNSSIYNCWDKSIDNNIELIAVELTGRSNRMFEEPIHDMDKLVEVLYENIKCYLNKPFAFFGHSMGGLISYALSKKIEENTSFKLDFLIISATLPPFYYLKGKIHKYSDEDLIKVLKNQNNTPQEALDSKELMELMIPTIRADYKLIETYNTENISTLKSKVILFNSEEDIDKQVMIQWQSYFVNSYDYKVFKGNHFFLKLYQEEVISNINNIYYTYSHC